MRLSAAFPRIYAILIRVLSLIRPERYEIIELRPNGARIDGHSVTERAESKLTSRAVHDLAPDCGFDAAGVAAPGPVPEFARFQAGPNAVWRAKWAI